MEQPARQHDVGEGHDVVAVHVRDEQRGERMRGAADLREAQDSRAAGVELESDIAVLHEGPRARTTWRGQRHPGPGECDDRGRRAHSCFPTVQPWGVSTSVATARGTDSSVVAIVSFQRLR